MIEDIEIFNVGFGDCFICGDKSNKMMVDCGSLRPGKVMPTVIPFINKSLKAAGNAYLMVTHFHSDHMSGIKYLDKSIKFKEVYLPNFFYKSMIRLQFACLACLEPESRVGEFAFRLLTLIPDIQDYLLPASRLNFVGRGDRIINSLDECRVLWPETALFETQANALYNEMFDDPEQDAEKAKERNRVRDLVESSSANYFETVSSYISEDGDRTNASLRQLNDFVERCRNRAAKDLIKVSRSVKYKISRLQNKICLCFDNLNKDKSVLFLSDITVKSYNEMYKLGRADKIELQSEYNTIKVAHHGTKDYFVNDLPQSENLIISNGKVYDISWRITSLYSIQYNKRIFYCTNANACDYHLSNKNCLSQSRGGKCGICISYTLNL